MKSTRRQNGLYRRNGGIFCFRYKNQDGMWREKSTGTSDRKAAVAQKGNFLDALKNDELPGDKAEWTVEQACSRWVDQHVLRSTKAKSNERSSLRQLVRLFGEKKLKAITLDHLKDYQAKRSEAVAARPINLELGILVKVLKEENLWKRSLSEHYRRLKEPDGEIATALSIDELARLERTAASRDSWLVAYCAEVLAATTGMRGGEIKKLRLGAIDLENRRIRITRSSTKTDAGARLIELNRDALIAAAKLRNRAETLGAVLPAHYLLPADLSKHTRQADPLHGGRGFDPTQHQVSWNTAWRNLRNAAGLRNLRFHDLRHTFVTMMGERGVPLQVLAAMVGHLSPAMVRYYTHISGNAARAAVEMLEKDRITPQFVDVFVDDPKSAGVKLLN
jgi:integrase